jgi:Holin of 3TMs, for gene-transfer release
MGVIGRILGMGAAARQVGGAVGGVAEVLVGNQALRDRLAGQLAASAVDQFGAEFARASASRFDGFVNGLNRLPRPLLALSTIGLFSYAMAEPAGFGTRMQSLALVPEPLWWLLGAIVSFYFGARELHHQRTRSILNLTAGAAAAPVAGEVGVVVPDDEPASVTQPVATLAAIPASIDPDHNAAVEEWRRQRA